MKILKILSIEKPFTIFNYKGKAFYFTRIGTIRSRLNSETLEVLWTADLNGFDFSESDFAFYDDYLIAPSIYFDVRNNKIITFSNVIRNFRWSRSINEKYVLFGTKDDKSLEEVGVYDLVNEVTIWKSDDIKIAFGAFTIDNVAFSKSHKNNYQYDGIISFNYLTGSTLWQRSFEDLGISQLDKFVGDVGDVLVCVCDENNLIGLNKSTGKELWRVNHRAKLSDSILNIESKGIYLFYGWADQDETIEEVNLNLLEIDSQTGQIRYDDDIFKHPKHQTVEGLWHNKSYRYPRFHSALQWGTVIYFLAPVLGITPLAQIIAFDTVQKRIIETSEQLFTTFHHWFVAEGKLFITAKVGKRVETETNPDPNNYGIVRAALRFDGEVYQNEYIAISKEEYLTIIDLEDN